MFRLPLLLLVLMLAIASSLSAAGPSLHNGTLTLRTGDYEVTFVESAAWTLGRVNYRGKAIIVRTGANQSVLNLKSPREPGGEPWVGTSHGGEEITNVTLEVDGRPYPAEQFANAAPGTRYRLLKTSRLGPLLCESEVTLEPSGLTERFRFKAEGDLATARYLYVFMHCFAPTLGDWLAVLPDGQLVEEPFPGEKATHLRRDLKTLALYNEEQATGVIVRFPEAYHGEPGHSHFLINWPGRHHKHYFRVAATAVDGGEYLCHFEAFTGSKEAWRERARTAQP
ncbi:MAG TPA: hypothetical protein VNQ90_01715 [Chthoniobacteraceae bacterium]|nr:hypothetical protein [Chthoniobacteraceae bacterium]